MTLDPKTAFERILDSFADKMRSTRESDRENLLEGWKRSFQVLAARDGSSEAAIEGWVGRVESALSSRLSQPRC